MCLPQPGALAVLVGILLLTDSLCLTWMKEQTLWDCMETSPGSSSGLVSCHYLWQVASHLSLCFTSEEYGD